MAISLSTDRGDVNKDMGAGRGLNLPPSLDVQNHMRDMPGTIKAHVAVDVDYDLSQNSWL